VTDLVDGLYKLLLSDINTPVNIGNPQEMTMLELAEQIKRLANSKSKIVFKLLPQDDPKVRCPDITLARKKLDWKPRVPAEKGLAETIGYFRGKLDK